MKQFLVINWFKCQVPIREYSFHMSSKKPKAVLNQAYVSQFDFKRNKFLKLLFIYLASKSIEGNRNLYFHSDTGTCYQISLQEHMGTLT